MKLSIIIPIYNVEKYILKTINSLINQSEKQFEIIFVDDGSTDNTVSVVESILQQNKLNNCKLIKTKNGGVSSARNKGLFNASGKYVIFLDGDDYVSRDLVKNIYIRTYSKESDIVFWGFNKVNEKDKITSFYFDKYKLHFDSMTGTEALNNIVREKTMWIWTGSAAYKREFLAHYNLKYTDNCASGEDQEFAFKALSRAKDVVFIQKVLSFYLQRETAISCSYSINRFDVIAAMGRVCAYIEENKNRETEKILNIIESEFIVENYLHNFNSCLRYIHRKQGFRNKNFQYLCNEIDEHYPGINKHIANIMGNYNKNSKKTLLKHKIFTRYPFIYSYLLYIKII